MGEFESPLRSNFREDQKARFRRRKSSEYEKTFIPSREIPNCRRRFRITPRTVTDKNLKQWIGYERVIFAGESVTEGHPDKMADQISEQILDLYYREG